MTYREKGELRLESGTEPEDIREYVERRVKAPLEFEEEGVVVWNLSNHEVDEAALNDKLEDLRMEYYVIPYEVPGVWAYMQEMLPDQVRLAELLVYSQTQDRYKAFPNYVRVSNGSADRNLAMYLWRWLDEEGL